MYITDKPRFPRKYCSRFIVTANDGRKIKECESIEQAEYFADLGRNRHIFSWFEGIYVHRRTMGSDND